jgi:hypothetical protein
MIAALKQMSDDDFKIDTTVLENVKLLYDDLIKEMGE